jgi:pyrroline-5-carboxylate reductase
MLQDKKLAVLGAGKLGEALIGGLLDAGAIDALNVTVTAAHQARVDTVRERFGVNGTLSNPEAVEGADVVLLAVKPQTVPHVLEELGDALHPDQLLVSVAASVGTAFIDKRLPAAVPVVRAMPNTPCLLRMGMTGIAPGAHATDEHVTLARSIFEAVGRVVVLDDKHMDAVTALSASGPAYLCVIIESLAEAGVKVGLPRDVATELAAQTVVGTGHMVLETGEHPALLKAQVTTPAGCTVDGLLELEVGGLRVTLIKAVVEATRRARELLET